MFLPFFPMFLPTEGKKYLSSRKKANTDSSAAVTMPDSVDRSEFKSTLPCFLKEPLKAVVPFYLVYMPMDVKDPTRGGGGGVHV